MILKRCLTCGEGFKIYPYSLRHGWGKFCTGRCYGISKKGKRISRKTEFKKKQAPWNKGKKYSQISGEKHWNWKGGITPVIIQIRRCFEYKTWSKSVFQRDDWTCKFCGKRSGNGKRVLLHADHYPKTFSKIIEANKIRSFEGALSCKELWNIEKGRTLCAECHDEWTGKFMTENWGNQFFKDDK